MRSRWRKLWGDARAESGRLVNQPAMPSVGLPGDGAVTQPVLSAMDAPNRFVQSDQLDGLVHSSMEQDPPGAACAGCVQARVIPATTASTAVHDRKHCRASPRRSRSEPNAKTSGTTPM